MNVSSDDVAETERWAGRPRIARAVRIAVYVVPFLASVATALILSAIIPPAPTWTIAVIRFVAIAACATVVLYGVDKGTRRLLPLAALLDLTLIFPDEAPSRFKVAFRSGGTRELEHRLTEFRKVGADEPARAAELLLGLVADLSQHDRLTRGHSERVRAYAQMIGEELGLDEAEVDKLRWAALLHDVGKLEVPFEILNKPGRLTAEEYDVVKEHPTIGAELAAPLASWLGEPLRAVAEHHERWDGAGYPNGLRGDDIALAARIVSVADVFDVLTSARSYKSPGTAAEAREELADCAGSHFDPTVVRAFLSISLGKLRMAMGPLSWLTQFSMFPSTVATAGAAPAMTTLAGMTAAAVGFVGAPADFVPAETPAYVAAGPIATPAPDDDIDVRTPKPITDGAVAATDPATAPATDALATGPATVADSTTPPTTGSSTPPEGSTTEPTTTEPTTTTTTAERPARLTPVTPVATATTGPVTTTPTTSSEATTSVPSPTTTPPTTPPPTTPPPATTTPPTTAPPTTTTSTTTSTTTTTVPLPTGSYLLGSSAPGDVSSEFVLPIVKRSPLNATLPNFDVDRDDDEGLLLVTHDSEFPLPGPESFQRFRLDPSTPIKLDGRAGLTIHVAAADLQAGTVQATAVLADCPDTVWICTWLATVTVDVTVEADQFVPATVDFGEHQRLIPVERNLEVWLVATKDSEDDLWLAYDTVGYESALILN